MTTETKFQVWAHDSFLVGHLTGYTEKEAEERKLEYARDVWESTLGEDDVSLCEISVDYYTE